MERKAKADGKKAQKAAEKFSVALSANIKANVSTMGWEWDGNGMHYKRVCTNLVLIQAHGR